MAFWHCFTLADYHKQPTPKTMHLWIVCAYLSAISVAANIMLLVSVYIYAYSGINKIQKTHPTTVMSEEFYHPVGA